MAYAIPDPPDLDDDPGPVTVDDSIAVVELAAEYGCSPADMVRWLADGGPEGAEQPPPDGANRWLVTDDASAEWALSKMCEANEALEGVGRQHEEWAAPLRAKLAKVDEWAATARRAPEATLAHMAALCERYALARREATGKAGVTLPSGRLATLQGRQTLAVWDEAAAVDQLAELAAEAVKVKRSLLVSKLEWVPGWAWEATTERGDVLTGLTWPGEAPVQGDVVDGQPVVQVDVYEVPCVVVGAHGEREDAVLVQLEGLRISGGEITAKVHPAG
jgi:hypothetical protein